VPAQPEGVSVFNVQFSSINPNRIAFNYIDAEEHSVVKIVNFGKSGQDSLLQFPGRNVERPSFSPDNKSIVVDRLGGNPDTEAEEAPAERPEAFVLEANYPNPFNAGTKISYTLQRSSQVHVAIYDIRGRLLLTLADGVQAEGRHTLSWQGCDAEGRPLSSGVYFCRMQAGDEFHATQKMLMVK
jgi:hypothetical protein